MKYELVREISNLCRNNQMRDVFFLEVETDDPEEYIRTHFLRGNTGCLRADRGEDGRVTVYTDGDGLSQKFVFTPV